MSETDSLPELVRDFELREARAAELLDQYERNVRHMSRTYPGAWFATGHKDEEGVVDLAHRTFTVCARVEKGRFPFSSRRPFRCFVEEQFDGRAVRYHSFYAKLSIARELMRDDYARNLRRDPVLRWRADLYGAVGDVLKAMEAAGALERQSQGNSLPPRWAVTATGPRLTVPLARIEDALRDDQNHDLKHIVEEVLRRGGPLSQSRLTNVAEAVLGTPEAEDPVFQTAAPPAGVQVGIRRSIVRAWETLDGEDRNLMVGLARGDSYDDIIARQPRLKHRVAATRAVTRCGQVFLAAVAEEAGIDPTGGIPAGIQPRRLVECVLEVLAEVVPEIQAAVGHTGGAR